VSATWLLARGLREWLTGLALAMVGLHLTLLLADSQAGVGAIALRLAALSPPRPARASPPRP
jgi:hypothetical protein